VPDYFNPDNHYRNTRNLYPGIASFNMLCFHRSMTKSAPEGLEEVTDATRHPLARER